MHVNRNAVVAAGPVGVGCGSEFGLNAFSSPGAGLQGVAAGRCIPGRLPLNPSTRAEGRGQRADLPRAAVDAQFDLRDAVRRTPRHTGDDLAAGCQQR